MQSLSNKVHALLLMTPDQQEISKHRSEASQSPGFNTLKTGYWGTPPPVLTKATFCPCRKALSHCCSNTWMIQMKSNLAIQPSRQQRPLAQTCDELWNLTGWAQVRVRLAEEGLLPHRFNFLASALCSDSRSRVIIKGLQQNLMVHKYQSLIYY